MLVEQCTTFGGSFNRKGTLTTKTTYMEKADFVQNKKKSSLLPDVQTPSLTSETKSSSTSNKMIPTKEDVVNKKQSKEYTKKRIALNEGIQFPNIVEQCTTFGESFNL